jgi:16S rRNA (guanine527-N7)-methyltransferase
VTDIAAILRNGAALALDHALSERQVDSLVMYLNLLIKWQRSQRLIGSSDPGWIVENLIIDSLLFRRVLPDVVATLCDVGSGAGIPGIPLRIVMPNTDVTLIEARARRVSFLSTAVRELSLARCRIIGRRLEDVADQLTGTFDAVVMRCAGNPSSLLELIRRLLTPTGVIVATGPPEAHSVSAGEWAEVDGPRGRRRFWLYRAS